MAEDDGMLPEEVSPHELGAPTGKSRQPSHESHERVILRADRLLGLEPAGVTQLECPWIAGPDNVPVHRGIGIPFVGQVTH